MGEATRRDPLPEREDHPVMTAFDLTDSIRGIHHRLVAKLRERATFLTTW